MLTLLTGSYLGNQEKHKFDGQIGVCITSYTDAGQFSKMHCHENPHLSLVLNGGSLEKRKSGEIQRMPGKVTFYHSGEYHQSTNLEESSRHINMEFGSLFLTDNAITEENLQAAVSNNPDTKFLLIKICKELFENDEFSTAAIKMILFELVNNHTHFELISKKRGWLKKMEEILRAHLDSPISLGLLSKEFGMHPVTISKQFHESYSCTLGEYMRKLRVEKALTLIKSSDYNLTEIAYLCGFADQSHFIRVFKQLTGLLPHAFQKF